MKKDSGYERSKLRKIQVTKDQGYDSARQDSGNAMSQRQLQSFQFAGSEFWGQA